MRNKKALALNRARVGFGKNKMKVIHSNRLEKQVSSHLLKQCTDTSKGDNWHFLLRLPVEMAKKRHNEEAWPCVVSDGQDAALSESRKRKSDWESVSLLNAIRAPKSWAWADVERGVPLAAGRRSFHRSLSYAVSHCSIFAPLLYLAEKGFDSTADAGQKTLKHTRSTLTIGVNIDQRSLLQPVWASLSCATVSASPAESRGERARARMGAGRLATSACSRVSKGLQARGRRGTGNPCAWVLAARGMTACLSVETRALQERGEGSGGCGTGCGG
jgi:hypothetical protein